jgi:hypothetical protein
MSLCVAAIDGGRMGVVDRNKATTLPLCSFGQPGLPQSFFHIARGLRPAKAPVSEAALV